MVADLLERGDRGEDLTLARLLALGDVGGDDELVEHRLVQADLLGRHRAVVELVDPIGQLGGDLRLGLRAPEHQDAVERAQGVLGGARRFAFAVRELRDELRPRADETGIGEVEDRPEVAEPVLDRRARERDAHARGDAAELLRGVARGVLDGLRLVEDHLAPRDRGDRFDVAHRGAVGGDHDIGVGGFARDLVERRAVRAVVHDDAERRREPRRLRRPVADDRGRRDHERGAGAGAREDVREHRRRLAETHVEGEAATEAGGVEEAEPRQRLGLVAAELADEPGGCGRGLGGEVRRGRQQIGGPASAFDRDAARERRSLEAEGEPQHLRARQLRRRRRVRRARRPPRSGRRGRSRPSARRSG